LRDAQDWYEGESKGLGLRFREAVDALVQRMTANPRLKTEKAHAKIKAAVFMAAILSKLTSDRGRVPWA